MKYLAALALAVVSTPVLAQGQAPAQAPAVAGPETFIAFATQVATNVDQGRAAIVWDRASQALKSSTPKDRFISQIQRKQQSNGTPVARAWQSVVRSAVNSSGRAGNQGQMVTVTFLVTTSRNTSYSEVIQFIVEPDNLWRTSAYIN